MKILSEEDGDTIMNDHFEEDEPMNTSIDNELLEIIIGFAQRYSQAQDFVELGDKSAVAGLLDEAIAAIHSTFTDAGYINKDEIDTWQADFKKRWNAMTGAEWLERFMGNIPAGWLLEDLLIDAARRASSIEEDET